jgi:D-xylose transport system ATP-binding protein
MSPVLELSGIHKHFGAVHALRGADFQISAGEVLALVGDNGAGKSTLVKIMAGVYQPDEGTIRFEGRAVHLRSPDDANRLGIETVYQDLALCDNLDIVGNMFLGRELGLSPLFGRRAGSVFYLLSEREMARRAREVLRDLQVTTVSNVRTEVARLSGGQRQAVAIARAVLWNSRIVMLDEPTAALGVQQTEQVLELVVRLRSRGLGVILISHNLDHVFRVADRIDVLRLGRRVLSVPRADTTSVAIVHAITGASSSWVEASDDV